MRYCPGRGGGGGDRGRTHALPALFARKLPKRLSLSSSPLAWKAVQGIMGAVVLLLEALKDYSSQEAVHAPPCREAFAAFHV